MIKQLLRTGAAKRAAGALAAGGVAAFLASDATHCEEGVYVEMRSSIFVINGFYMAMREKYTSPKAVRKHRSNPGLHTISFFTPIKGRSCTHALSQ
jgi:hypothetical protein